MAERVNIFDAIGANKRNSYLLIFLVLGVFLGMVWILSEVFGFGQCGYIFGFVALAVYAVTAFFAGDRIVLALSGAKEITREQYPFIYNVAEGLSMAAGIPMPKIYLIDDPSPNAFATGRDPQHSSLAVTRGLLETMNREELEGVVAHEISHIANYDIRFMTLTIVLVGAIGLLSQIAIRSFLFGGAGGGNKGKGGVLVIIGIIFMILAPIAALFVRMAISRQREYLADANAAKLTRYPPGLANALEKIKKNAQPMKNASDTTAPLYISNPFAKAEGMFATHPPLDDRIKRLRSM
ncbi:M48 family metalloprotease [Candidatus Micrarchaeota archaeon]|nr:M48 family metalloprotease [Candidatus Micrarchaeota archaeon]